MKERIAFWDNFKGLLIALVVLGHFLWEYRGQGAAGSIVSIIYFFHMPAFTFAAGFLSKSPRARSKDAIRNLLTVYIIFNTGLMLFSHVLLDTSWRIFTPYYSAWFLLSLIVWRLGIDHVARWRHIIPLSLVIALVISLWPDATNVLALSRTIVFFPFFLLGYVFPEDKFYAFVQGRRASDYIKGLVLLAFTLCLSVLFARQGIELNQAVLTMGPYGHWSEIITRFGIFCIALLMLVSLTSLMPNRPLGPLTKWGKNSLSIYVLHRFVTLGFVKLLPADNYSPKYIYLAIGATAVTLFLLGTDFVSRGFAGFIQRIREGGGRRQRIRKLASPVLLLVLLLPLLADIMPTSSGALPAKQEQGRDIHQIMSAGHEAALEDTVSIAFVGDLILLQDQVRRAYSSIAGEYDFSSMFAYAKPYLSGADLAIGVFEGPSAGPEAGYSSSNYGDGLPLSLNYPDSFAHAVKDSGIDLVTTANNHLLDKGVAGAMRTLDVLEEAGLLHVGSYRNAAEKEMPLLIEVKGVRIAVLAYTYGSNGYSAEYFLRDNPSLTSIIVDPEDKHFPQVKEAVLQDFARIKNTAAPPDLILVLPHMGEQFSHSTNAFQDTWNDIFIAAGADIILGDHAHAVQPIEFRPKPGSPHQAIIVNCPGNFANSYVEKNGDATSIVEIYINPHSKEIVCAGVVPMYTQSPANGNHRALPIYSILRDSLLHSQVSRYEMKRVEVVHSLVTEVMLGTRLTLDQIQERYYLFPTGYVRQRVQPMTITPAMKEREMYTLLSQTGSVCFVGDSVTAGSHNGGYGWYEPLAAAFPNLQVSREAWAGATTRVLLEKVEDINSHKADVYVVAIGTNDVRYRDESTCAMTPGEYVSNLDLLAAKLREGNLDAKFIFISPWLAQANDPFTALPADKRDRMLQEYGEELSSYCSDRGFTFIDPNPAIAEVLSKSAPTDYLLDHIHPNAGAGILLYSDKVLGTE